MFLAMQLTLLWYKTLFPFCLCCYRHVGGSFRTAVRITHAVGGRSFAAKSRPCKITLRQRRLFVHVWGSYSPRFYRESPGVPQNSVRDAECHGFSQGINVRYS